MRQCCLVSFAGRYGLLLAEFQQVCAPYGVVFRLDLTTAATHAELKSMPEGGLQPIVSCPALFESVYGNRPHPSSDLYLVELSGNLSVKFFNLPQFISRVESSLMLSGIC